MAAGGYKETVECGFCLSRNEALRSPKVLPCGHVHCLECLQQLFTVYRVVQCPLPSCRGMCDWNDLCAWKNSEVPEIIFGDVRLKKNSNTKSPAVSFHMSCDTRICPNHAKVGIVSAYPKMSDNIKKVINNSVPEMTEEKSPTLVPACSISKGENRDIEQKVDTPTANKNGCQADTTSKKTSCDESVIPTVSPLPWSLKPIWDIKTPGEPRSVCFDQEIMHIALDERRIITASIGQGGVSCSGIYLPSYINSFASHGGKLYVLVDGEPSEILVLACATLKMVRKWTHTDVPFKWNGISVCSRGVAACDRLNSWVIIYSHTGQEMTRIALPHLVTGWVAACFAGPDAIIVSHHDNSELLKLEVDTGEVAWTCYMNFEPLGVTCYGDDWILAAAYECTNVAVINSSTGTLVHEIQQALPRGKVFGLAIGLNDILLAADFNAQKIVAFKIKLK